MVLFIFSEIVPISAGANSVEGVDLFECAV